MRRQLGVILGAEGVMIGVVLVDFALRPLFSAHGFGLLIAGTGGAVGAGMAIAIFATRRGPSGDRDGRLTVGEGWWIGIALVASMALLVGWLVEAPTPSVLLLVATTAMTLSLLVGVVVMRRRRV